MVMILTTTKDGETKLERNTHMAHLDPLLFACCKTCVRTFGLSIVDMSVALSALLPSNAVPIPRLQLESVSFSLSVEWMEAVPLSNRQNEWRSVRFAANPVDLEVL